MGTSYIPSDFDEDRRKRIHDKVKPKSSNQQPAWDEFVGAWGGLLYRFCACADHDDQFTQVTTRAGTPTPGGANRYIQERELFEFFVTGLSTIECLCYGMYMVGSFVRPGTFPASTEAHLRAVNPKSTSTAYQTAFPDDRVTKRLTSASASTDFDEWKKVRDSLAHRTHRGRTVLLSELSDRWPIKEHVAIEIDGRTTATRRNWLADTVKGLLSDLEVLVDAQF